MQRVKQRGYIAAVHFVMLILVGRGTTRRVFIRIMQITNKFVRKAT
jgi:hypothetical protein